MAYVVCKVDQSYWHILCCVQGGPKVLLAYNILCAGWTKVSDIYYVVCRVDQSYWHILWCVPGGPKILTYIMLCAWYMDPRDWHIICCVQCGPKGLTYIMLCAGWTQETDIYYVVCRVDPRDQHRRLPSPSHYRNAELINKYRNTVCFVKTLKWHNWKIWSINFHKTALNDIF